MTSDAGLRDHATDRVAGMLLLGAYGDALGAPHESESLLGGTTDADELGRLKEVESYHGSDRSRSPWWVWADASALTGMRGVPTDDTSYRFMHLHLWIEHSVRTGTPLDEPHFRRWLEEPRKLPAERFFTGIPDSHLEQAECFVDMFRAAKNGESFRFYEPGTPVFFGPFLYLELAATRLGREDEAVLMEFNEFCSLDQGIGRTVTGCFAALLTRSLAAERIEPAEVFPFLLDSSERLLSLAKTHSLDGVGELRDVMETAVALGRKYQGRSSRSYVASQSDLFQADSTRSLKAFDPVLLWRQFWGALSFADASPLRALATISAGPGDSDTVASFTGTIFGALYGRDRLMNETLNGVGLGTEMTLMEGNLQRLFRADVGDRARMLVSLVPTI